MPKHVQIASSFSIGHNSEEEKTYQNKKCQFLDQSYVPETNILGQFLGPEAGVMGKGKLKADTEGISDARL